MSATKKHNPVQLWDAFVAANEEYVRAGELRQMSRDAYRKSLKRMTVAHLEEKLREVWPDHLVEKGDYGFRFKPFKNKPWGSVTHLESREGSRKGVLIEALDTAIMRRKVKW